MRIILVLLLAALALLQSQLWFGERSLGRLNQLHQSIADQRQRNAALEQQNRQLERQIQALRHDQDAIAGRARRDLVLIGENETLYLMPDAPRQPPKTAPDQPQDQ